MKHRPGELARFARSKSCWSHVVLVLAICFGIASGCVGELLGPHPRHPEYSFGFYNATRDQLSKVEATWEYDHVAYRASGGLLRPKAQSQDHFAPDPIPPKVTVAWTTANGEQRSVAIEVAANVPDVKTFTGTIWFKFVPDGSVTLVPMTEAEKWARSKRGKSAEPE